MARVRRLSRSGGGRDASIFLIEGIRIAEEALASPIRLREAILSPRLERTDRGRRLAEALRAAVIPVWRADDRLARTIGDAESHQGVLLVADRPIRQPEDLVPAEGPALLAVCAGIQDPGNLGGIVRMAEAAGCCALLALEGADPFGPKAVRASAGSILRLPVARIAGEGGAARLLTLCRDARLPLFGAAPRGGAGLYDAELPPRAGIVLGGEGPGLEEALLSGIAGRLTIPMRPPVESLNVAAAAAILLMHASRRKGAIV